VAAESLYEEPEPEGDGAVADEDEG